MRTLALLSCLAVSAAAQISPPRIGFVRDLAGALRPVLGVAGVFVLGEPVVTGIVAAASSGNHALADTGSEILLVSLGTVVWRGASAVRADGFGFTKEGLAEWVRFADGTCLLWTGNGEPKLSQCPVSESPSPPLRIAVPEGVQSSEGLAPGWLVLRSPGRLYLVHTAANRAREDAIYVLPEAIQPSPEAINPLPEAINQ